MGHTRWATHGQPTDRNAHPHVSTDKKIAVVHNGIIENHAAAGRTGEPRGSNSPPTPTPTAVHLIEREYAWGVRRDFVASAYATLRRLKAVHPGLHPLRPSRHDRRRTPVHAARGPVGDGEMFVGSDVTAFIEQYPRCGRTRSRRVVVTSPPTHVYDHRFQRQRAA